MQVSLRSSLTSIRNTTLDRLESISSWSNMKRAVATMFKFRYMLILVIIKSKKIYIPVQFVNMNLLQRSEFPIIKVYQQRYFQNEISRIIDEKCFSRQSNLFKLGPFLGNHKIIRASGKISQYRMKYKLKHPILLTKNVHIMSVIICFYHRRDGHGGRRITINEIRNNGFWAIYRTADVK